MRTTLEVGDVIVQYLSGVERYCYTVLSCTKTQALALCDVRFLGVKHHKRFRIYVNTGGMVEATGHQYKNVIYMLKGN